MCYWLLDVRPFTPEQRHKFEDLLDTVEKCQYKYCLEDELLGFWSISWGESTPLEEFLNINPELIIKNPSLYYKKL